MKASHEGQDVLQERPRITNELMERCRDLPSSSFGATYLQFMGERSFEANDRPPVRFVDNEEQVRDPIALRRANNLISSMAALSSI